MRNAGAPGYEGPANLLDAFRVAAAPESRGKGVLVVLNDEINSAREVTKTDALRLQTFQSRGYGMLGVVDPDRVVYYREALKRHTSKSEFDLASVTALPRVDIMMFYQGASSDLLQASVDAGAKGVIIAVAGADLTGGFLAAGIIRLCRTIGRHGGAPPRQTSSGRICASVQCAASARKLDRRRRSHAPESAHPSDARPHQAHSTTEIQRMFTNVALPARSQSPSVLAVGHRRHVARQLVFLFVLAIPIASIAWTVTHEEVFREPRDWCVAKANRASACSRARCSTCSRASIASVTTSPPSSCSSPVTSCCSMTGEAI